MFRFTQFSRETEGEGLFKSKNLIQSKKLKKLKMGGGKVQKHPLDKILRALIMYQL